MKKKSNEYRVEKDTMGEVKIPSHALYGPQTQRAVDNFTISDLIMPKEFISSLLLVKIAAAKANYKLGLLDKKICIAIITSADFLLTSFSDNNFPVDVFQTGSGTSTNMNVNEVISNVSNNKFKIKVHPNDHVNMSQSSNDVIPTAINHCAYSIAATKLLPSLNLLSKEINSKSKKLSNVVKTGRTHLMDAMPITFEQELSGWKAQVDDNVSSLKNTLLRLKRLTIGGTAVGTGINAHKLFAKEFLVALNKNTKLKFIDKKNKFEGLSSQDDIVLYSSNLRAIAISLIKISNDLRWMNSGPSAGISDITLKALQPGSSIMPGKVNPVIPESTIMACTQVIGNDTTIMLCGQSGNFQLNVTLPVIAYNIVQSSNIIANAAVSLSKKAISNFEANKKTINTSINSNPILITALNRIIGYEKGAYIAKKAYKLGLPILDVALKETNLSEKELKKLLDPLLLTKGGIK